MIPDCKCGHGYGRHIDEDGACMSCPCRGYVSRHPGDHQASEDETRWVHPEETEPDPLELLPRPWRVVNELGQDVIRCATGPSVFWHPLVRAHMVEAVNAYAAAKTTSTAANPGYTPDLDRILDGTYACTRVWEGWQVGTMCESDFVPTAETEIRGDLQTWRDRAIAAELRRLTTLREFRDLQDELQARANELDGDAR